jgi:hypothetical protein
MLRNYMRERDSIITERSTFIQHACQDESPPA